MARNYTSVFGKYIRKPQSGPSEMSASSLSMPEPIIPEVAHEKQFDYISEKIVEKQKP